MEPGLGRQRDIRVVEAGRDVLDRLLRGLGALLRRLRALLRGLRLLLGLRHLALQRLQLLLQRIDLPLHLIGLRILRERRREDRCENVPDNSNPRVV